MRRIIYNIIENDVVIFNKEFNLNIKFVEQTEDFETYNKKKVHDKKCFDCIYNRLLVSYNYADENGNYTAQWINLSVLFDTLAEKAQVFINGNTNGKKYDFVYLSNIYDYFDRIYTW